MSRRRKKRNHLSVSLFPFLAVLICTLGVLIVMLVMAVKSADVQAAKVQSEDDEEKQTQIDDLQHAVDLAKFQILSMKKVRPDLLERVEQSRANRSYLEDEIRKLKLQYQDVGRSLVQLERQKNQPLDEVKEFSQSEATQALGQLESQIAQAKSKLEEKREAAADVGPATYAIVPHKGGGGTFRRPIFIECTKDAITLQPSGIRLLKDEFTPPLEPGNMLDSALLANREYWERYDLAGEDGNPYPLMVVRPDGAETFVLARLAMKGWDDEFGYELVEANKVLEFGESDPQLEQEIRSAVAVARRRQLARGAMVAEARRNANANRLASYESRPGLSASGRYGGFVSSASGGSSDDEQNDQENGSTGDQVQSGSQTANTSQDFNSSDQTQSSAAQANQGGSNGDLSAGNPNMDMSLAKQRGADWALPSQTPGATGYLRPIRIHCGPDFIELRGANGNIRRIPFSPATSSAIDPLVDEIWKKIDGWGISGANSYWKPQLKISIHAGGETRFDELQGLLFRSGLLVEALRQ